MSAELELELDQGTYRVAEVGGLFEVRRNGRLIHTAGYMDAAIAHARIDNDDRARMRKWVGKR